MLGGIPSVLTRPQWMQMVARGGSSVLIRNDAQTRNGWARRCHSTLGIRRRIDCPYNKRFNNMLRQQPSLEITSVFSWQCVVNKTNSFTLSPSRRWASAVANAAVEESPANTTTTLRRKNVRNVAIIAHVDHGTFLSILAPRNFD
jgi:hypothetical protein